MKVILKTILIGVAGTLATDIWSLILKLFNIHSHGLLFVGNWIKSHVWLSLQNQFTGKELLIGWIAHYWLGISFAFLLILMYGKKWFQKPTFFATLILGFTTFIISLFVIQPILGFGIAFSKFPNQFIIIFKVFLFHLVYSTGLYLSAILLVAFETKFATKKSTDLIK